ncbi:hypothetical protein [Streptomyces lucensis]|uniref:hypothetical protein n=1 Tax=Streptomyces lucensis TaxID=67319 RepID=UPI00167ADFBA|nr:hypothetical protein [Streptomyces lucensis]
MAPLSASVALLPAPTASPGPVLPLMVAHTSGLADFAEATCGTAPVTPRQRVCRFLRLTPALLAAGFCPRTWWNEPVPNGDPGSRHPFE